jgi:hypothetical protein
MMQTAIFILAGYLGFACAIAVLWIGLSLRQQRSDRSIEVRVTSIEAQIDTFRMMASTKDLPAEEFQDFSLVFLAPVAQDQSSLTQ